MFSNCSNYYFPYFDWNLKARVFDYFSLACYIHDD
jgi:hypothetical protein